MWLEKVKEDIDMGEFKEWVHKVNDYGQLNLEFSNVYLKEFNSFVLAKYQDYLKNRVD